MIAILGMQIHCSIKKTGKNAKIKEVKNLRDLGKGNYVKMSSKEDDATHVNIVDGRNFTKWMNTTTDVLKKNVT